MGLERRKKRKTVTSTEPQYVDDQENGEENAQIKDFPTRLDATITNGYLIKFLLFTCFSFSCYVANWFYDIYLICNFYIHEDYWYSSFVVVFLVNAALQMGIASYSFYNKNGGKIIARDLLPTESYFSWVMKWVCHFFLIGLIPRYVDTIIYAIKGKFRNNDETKKIYLVAMIWEYAELTKLNQILGFMKSAGHLTLNLYIILTNKPNFEASSIIFPILSVISLSFALVSYDKIICLLEGIKEDTGDNKNEQNESGGITIDYKMSQTEIKNIFNTNWTEMTCQLIAHFFWIVSRVIALSLFATGYGWLIWPACCAHLIPTFIWHKKNKLNFLDAMRLSFLHLFAYLYPLANVSDKLKHPRLSPAMFQSVCFFENIFLMLMWTVSLKVVDGTFHHGISSASSYPWNEWTFFVPWIVQLATMTSSCLLFWWLDKKRQDNHNRINCIKRNHSIT